MVTYHISPPSGGLFKVIHKNVDGVTMHISMDRTALEAFLRGGYSQPGPLDVLTALDCGISVVALDG